MDRPDDGRLPLDTMCADIVERYHAALHRALPRVAEVLGAFAAACPAAAAREMREEFEELATLVSSHLAKEEHLVFPALCALSGDEQSPLPRPTFATVLHPIRLLESEHLRIEEGLDRLRELALTITEPDSQSERFRRCMTELADFDRLLREHHRIEDEELFPRALELEREVL